MKSTREKALRIVSGALLGSDLTARDIMEISELVIHDRLWAERLSRHIREVVQASERSFRPRQRELGASEGEDAEDFAAELTRLFSQKRMSKANALSVLRAAGSSKSWTPEPRKTLRENAETLVRTLPGPKEALLVVRRVSEMLGYGGDPYLRGLS